MFWRLIVIPFLSLFLSCFVANSNLLAADTAFNNNDFFCDNMDCEGRQTQNLLSENNVNNSVFNNNSSLLEKVNENPIKQSLTKKDLPKESWLVSAFKGAKNPFALNDTTGFYFFGGYVQNMELSPSYSFSNVTYSDSKYFTKKSGSGYNVALGARYYGSNFLFALEGYYIEQQSNHQYNITHGTKTTSNNVTTTTLTTAIVNIDVKRIYGLAAHIGGGFARVNVYGILGLAVGDISIALTDRYLPSMNESFQRTSIGITYGVGADFFLTDNFFLSVRYQEYKFNYSFVTTNTLDSVTNTPLTFSNDITLKNLSFGGGIKFF